MTDLQSLIEFEDRYNEANIRFFDVDMHNGEHLVCTIPELQKRERIVLDAWGSWEVHHYDDYRRRFGVFEVVYKAKVRKSMAEKALRTHYGPDIRYVLRQESQFSEVELSHLLLTGEFTEFMSKLVNLRYIRKDKHENVLYENRIHPVVLHCEL